MKNTDLKRRDGIVAALNQAAATFAVCKEDTFNEVMSNALSPIAEAVGLDRFAVYTYKDTDGGKRLGQMYFWDKLDGGMISLTESLVILPDNKVVKDWVSILTRNKSIFKSWDGMTEAERDFMGLLGVRSIFLAPIFSHGEIWGAVTFQDHTKGLNFCEGCEDLLCSAAHLCASAIINEQAQKNFNESFEAMEYSKRMADALNKAAAIFLSNSTETFEDMMTAGMGVIADMADLDRLNLWRNYSEPDGLYATQIYRWDRESGGTTKPTPELANISYSKIAPRWEELFLNKESINTPVSLLPGPEGDLMRAYGAVSVFITPIFIKGDFWGFLLFSDHRNERYFGNCAEMLRSAAFLGASAIIRVEMEREIIKINRLNRAILDSMPVGMAVIAGDPPTVIDCNIELARMFNAPKQQVIERYFEDFAPEYLNDGRLANHDAVDIMNRAMAGETVRTERLHQTAEGIPVPCDLTLTRIKDNDEFIGLGFLYDLRSVKNIEIELRKAVRLNRSTLESMPIGMIVFKGDPPQIVDCNGELENMFGASKEEIINHYFDRFMPEYLPDGKSSIEVALSMGLRAIAGETVRAEWPHLNADGVTVPCEITLTSVKDEEEFIGLGFLYNLTDIRAGEQELLSAYEVNELQLTKLNAVVKATKIGLYDVGIIANDFLHPDNTVIFTDEFRNMLGYSSEIDFPNTLDNWRNHLHPEDKEKAISDVVRHISDASVETPYDEEYRLLKKDGEYAYFRACGEAIRDKDGNVIRLAGALMDITETKNRLIHNELQLTKLNVLIRATKNGLWDTEIINHDSANPEYIFHWSDDFRRMLGYTDEDDFPDTENSWSGRIHPDDKDKVYDCFDKHLQDKTGNTPYDIEYRMYRKNGDCAYFRDTCAALRDENGYPIRVIGTLMDITETKRTLINNE